MNESDNKKMKIVLVTTGQPSINPRIVKEAEALSYAGHDVTMLYCHWITWADESDKAIIENAKWKAILVGGSPTKQRTKFYYTKLRFKIYRFLNKRNFRKFQVAEKAQARCYTELLKVASSIKADIFIGHNLGALPVVVNAAEAQKVKCGFDFEDYHRGEVKQMNAHDIKRIISLEEKYIPRCQYLSFASPLIIQRVLQNFPAYGGKTSVIYNCFPLIETALQNLPACNTLKLFWFSQTVGADRGLITALLALKLLNDPSIELTLIGNASTEIQRDFRAILEGSEVVLHFKGVVTPAEIDDFAANSDIGLALETGFSENNNIALSNKIFTYLSAGNAIIFSNTNAQKDFCTEYGAGLLFRSGDANDFLRCLQSYLKPETLVAQKMHNKKLAEKQFNWELESRKLLDIIHESL